MELCIWVFKCHISDVAVDSMEHLKCQASLAGVVSAEVDLVMNVLVSVCSAVVILGVGGVMNVFKNTMVILHKMTASVSLKNNTRNHISLNSVFDKESVG
jgi:hypothetical protein